jgi:hypothetical protein
MRFRVRKLGVLVGGRGAKNRNVDGCPNPNSSSNGRRLHATRISVVFPSPAKGIPPVGSANRPGTPPLHRINSQLIPTAIFPRLSPYSPKIVSPVPYPVGRIRYGDGMPKKNPKKNKKTQRFTNCPEPDRRRIDICARLSGVINERRAATRFHHRLNHVGGITTDSRVTPIIRFQPFWACSSPIIIMCR